ncbi:Pr6Pr family membrane protein [Paeniglutamicibacter sp. NPDC012692]|uniref:Pr6Pr family membrane protein n=1 Tax=Paeniglutamicibacter sp. NPDC012692 TaxID=3364388 RepID=UPI0036943545
MRRTLAYLLRIGGSIAIVAALVAQIQRTIQNESAGKGEVGFVVQNFFSFFTVEANVIAALALFVGIFTLSSRKSDSQGWTIFRAGATTYMATTGVVYNLLLRGIELPQGATVGWSNEILHVIGPVVMVLDWLIAPGRRPLNAKALWAIVAFPILWAGYTLVRGALVLDPRTGDPWFPYPFLNPHTSANGYFSVAFYIVLIGVLIGVVGAGVLRLSRAGRRS